MTDGSLETVIAFDFGVKRIGVAVGTRLTAGAQPLTIIDAGDDIRRFAAIGELISQWQPQRLVIGRPTHPDGQVLPVTARCERFARQLHGRFRLPVVLVDENYSSVAASEELRESALADDSHGRAAAGHGTAGGRQRRTGSRRSSGGGEIRDDALAAAIILRQYWSEHPSP